MMTVSLANYAKSTRTPNALFILGSSPLYSSILRSYGLFNRCGPVCKVLYPSGTPLRTIRDYIPSFNNGVSTLDAPHMMSNSTVAQVEVPGKPFLLIWAKRDFKLGIAGIICGVFLSMFWQYIYFHAAVPAICRTTDSETSTRPTTVAYSPASSVVVANIFNLFVLDPSDVSLALPGVCGSGHGGST